MSKRLTIARSGNTALTLSNGEMQWNYVSNTLHVHDGVTAGGRQFQLTPTGFGYEFYDGPPIVPAVGGVESTPFSLNSLTNVERTVEWQINYMPTNWGGVSASPDGCNVYVGSRTYERGFQWRMNSPWDWANVYHYGAQLREGSSRNEGANGSITAYGYEISPDGRYLYQGEAYSGDVAADRIIRRELSVPWDLTTTTWIRENNPRTQFSPLGPNIGQNIDIYARDANIFYTVDNVTDTVYEFTSTGSNIATAVVTASRSITSEETVPNGISFSPSGNAFFTIGNQGQLLEKWEMSTAWDIANATVSATSASLPTTVTPYSLWIDPNGQHVLWGTYAANIANVHHGYLSTPWDLSTFAESGTAISMAITDGTSAAASHNAFTWSTDGSNCYIGADLGMIAQYEAKTPFDLSTVNLQTKAGVDIGALTSIALDAIHGIAFKPDGTRMYVFLDNGQIRSFTLSTAWDISTISNDNKLFNATFGGGLERQIDIDPSGANVYVARSIGLYQLTLSTPWEINTAASKYGTPITLDNYSKGAQEYSIQVTPDGQYMYSSSQSIAEILKFKLTVPYDIGGGLTLVDKFPGPLSTASHVEFNPAGNNYVTISSTLPEMLIQFHLSNANVFMKTTTSNVSLDISSIQASAEQISFNPDGNIAHILGATGDRINQLRLSEAWNIETAVSNGEFAVGSQDSTPVGLSFNANGRVFYMVGNTTDAIYKYETTVPWDINFASYTSESKSGFNAPDALWVDRQSENTLYIAYDASRIGKLTMPTAHDLINSSLEWNPDLDEWYLADFGRGFQISSDGKKLWAHSFVTREIMEWDILVPYDLATLRRNYAGSFYELTADQTTEGFWVNEANNQIIIADSFHDTLRSYKGS